MKKLLILVSVFFTGLVLDVGVSSAVQPCIIVNGQQQGDCGDTVGVPGPADSETGLAGVVMAGGVAYLVWRRRKAHNA